MTTQTGFILGFDPGGRNDDAKYGKFGWSVCKPDGEGGLRQVNVGLVRDVDEALCAVRKEIKDSQSVLAAGIDAPLLWSRKGYRKIDKRLRECLLPSSRKSSVLHVNSLHSACTVQGVLLAKHLYKRYFTKKCSEARITETHPAVLRYLSKKCPGNFPNMEETLGDLSSVEDKGDRKSHMRDATISAYAAWAMIMCDEFPEWHDLYQDERFKEDFENPFRHSRKLLDANCTGGALIWQLMTSP